MQCNAMQCNAMQLFLGWAELFLVAWMVWEAGKGCAVARQRLRVIRFWPIPPRPRHAVLHFLDFLSFFSFHVFHAITSLSSHVSFNPINTNRTGLIQVQWSKLHCRLVKYMERRKSNCNEVHFETCVQCNWTMPCLNIYCNTVPLARLCLNGWSGRKALPGHIIGGLGWWVTSFGGGEPPAWCQCHHSSSP